MCNQLGRITASRMNFVSLIFDFKFASIRCSRSLLHFVKNKKLLPKVYCFKMLIMQNIFFRIKKKTFIYETAHVTSRQNFCPITVWCMPVAHWRHTPNFGSTEMSLFNYACKYCTPVFYKNFLWSLIVADLTTTNCLIACANVYSFN